MSVPKNIQKPSIVGIIRPFVANTKPEDLVPLHLPFVKAKGKKGRRLSYWNVKSTGAYSTDVATGRACAVELAQYLFGKPEEQYIFSLVLRDIHKKKEINTIEHTFLSVMAELIIAGTNATSKGLELNQEVVS